MLELKPEKIITTISNVKTGEVYKTEDEWKSKNIPESDIRRDVKVIMPSLDLLAKTKQGVKMAITRSQIARQLLAEGGVSLDDAKMMAPEGEFLAYINPKEADMLRAAGGSGIMTPIGIPSFIDYGDVESGLGGGEFGGGGDNVNDGFDTGEEFGRPTYSQQLTTIQQGGGGDGGGNQTGPKGPPGFGGGGGGGDYGQYITKNPYGKTISNFERRTIAGLTGLANPVAGITVNEILKAEQEKQKDLMKAIAGNQQYFGTLPSSLTTSYKQTTGMDTTPKGPVSSGGDSGDGPILPKLPRVATLPTDIETPKSDSQKQFDVRFFLDPRFALKDGGEVSVDEAEKMAPPGESLAYINDDEAALLKAMGGAGEPVNQTGIPSYFIKKVFKKAARAVKKVVKSDAFKVAALVGFGAYAGGLGPFSAAGKFGGLKGAGFAKGLFAGAKTGLGNLILGTPGDMGGRVAGTSLLSKLGGKAGLGILGASVAGGLLSGKQEEEVDSISSRISKETGLPIAQIRKEVQEATAEGQEALDALKEKYPFLIRADSALKDGGKAKKKTYKYRDKPYGPKFAAEGGIMDLGGNEMDLRGGGFVPIGKAEKADDVPARLSKNEFVFTADAVRAAGGGSVDKGADLMYKTMKQLEDRVA